jgi:hypothetical protein
MWEPEPLGTLRAYPVLYRNCLLGTKYYYQNKKWEKTSDFPAKECSFGYGEASLRSLLFAAMVD